MRIYEELFIVKASTPEEEVDALIEQMKGVVTANGGTVDKADRWGMRRLAYRVDKQTEGLYVLMQFTAPASTVKELERRLRVLDTVIKFITVRIDEKLKKIEKRKKVREKRAHRKPAPAAAPALPTAEQMMAQGSGAMPGAPAPGAPAPAVPAPAAPVQAAPAPTVAAPDAAEKE
jgi:small subunit ribosomal protein S6